VTPDHTQATDPDPEVSVVVPAYRGIDTICECLASIYASTRDWRCEVIVVESSGDGAAALVRQQFPEATVIESSVRLSAGQARNEGARQARGRWVLCADQDCIVPADWADRLVTLLRNPAVGAAGGSIAVANPSNISGWCVYFLEFMYHFPSRGRVQEGNFLIGANSAWRADILQQVAFPDQTLGEDRRLSHDVRKLGMQVLYDPSISVRHHNRRGWREFIRYCDAMGRSSAEERLRAGGRLVAFLQSTSWLSLLLPLAVLPMIGWRLLVGRPSHFLLYLVLLAPCALGQLIWANAFRRVLARPRSFPATAGSAP
jgi:cellulose synthase/poly-beta-1,6-N-acetylglucosamine synthase-like glycosyltransferase